MNEVQQLVLDAVEQTGAAAPAMLDSNAPIFESRADVDPSLYMVGLIGGKDVGKSSLVNALVGQSITTPSSFGEGTGRVIAYVHESASNELRALLDREIGGEHFSIITHRVDALRSQALLDLPDIDSHWRAHVQLTRRMLRHMLFPIWVQSIEKYADQQPQDLLRAVSEGNDPSNFLFCLNKADQLVSREGPAAAEALRGDFAQRLAAAVKLPHPPQVYLISAEHPDQFDLPALRAVLSHAKSTSSVERSIGLASRRRERSLLDWLSNQRLPDRASRASRLLRDAQEMVAERIAVPLMEDTLPRITSDPAHRMGLVEPAMNKRLSRWPIVNVIQASLSPLMALVRKNLSAAPQSDRSESGLIANGHPLSTRVQTTFAQLRQSDPAVADLYDSRPLWDHLPAELAATDLAARIQSTIALQSDEAIRRIARAGPTEIIAAPLRWILTIGAALWFPLIQPILERVLVEGIKPQLHDFALLVVPLLGASYLLHSAAFLIIYFAALWMLLRWDTQRRVNRLIARWSAAKPDSNLSLPGQVANWTDDLLDPLVQHEQQARALSDRLQSLREEADADQRRIA